MEPGPLPPRSEELLTHGRFLRSLARALVSDAERAEDLVQDTWVAALEHPPRHGAAPRAWLAQILRRLAIKKGLREGERGTREQSAVLARDAAEPGPLALAAEIEVSRRVLECVEHLREPYRSTLYLRYYRGSTPQRIAAEQRVPVKTVKTRLARGLEFLREDLDRRHGGRREAWVALLLPLARAPLVPPTLPAPQAAALPLAGAVVAVLAVLGGGAYWLTRPRAERAEHRPGPAPAVPAQADHASIEAPDAAVGRQALGGVEGARPVEARTLRLRGRVCDAGGAALAGAEVTGARFDLERRGPFGHGRPPEGEPEPVEVARTASDARGEFDLELSGSGLARLAVEADGFAPRVRKLLVFLGQDLDLGSIALEPGVFLAGTVRDERGAPVAGAEILELRQDEGLVLGPGDGHRATIARTDEQGRFALARVAAGPWRLELTAPGFAPASAEGATAEPGERVEGLELTLAAGAEVRGRVLGLTADELARARVLAVLPARDGFARPASREAVPDARGAFRLEGLAPGAELDLALLVDEDGRAGGRAASSRARAGDVDVELVAGTRSNHEGARTRPAAPTSAPAAPTGALEVVVRSEDGAPAPGALVARRAGDGGRRGPDGEIRAADRDGRVRWDELAAGRHELRVLTGVFGFQEQGEAWTALEVRAGETSTLALDAVPRAAVRGRVRSAGTPLARARVLLRPADEGRGPALTTTSDALGRFELDDLPLGTYRLELTHPARALPEERTLELVAPGVEVELDLADARLAGIVRDLSGRALEGVALRVLPGEDDSGMRGPEPRAPVVRSDALGHFEIAGLDPARAVRLELAAEGFATLRSAPLAPDSYQELALAPEAVLALTLQAAQAPSVLLCARGPHGEERTLELAAGRRTELRGLAAGTWHLELQTRRGPREKKVLAERSVQLEPGRTTELEW